METPVLTKKQQKKALSSKKAPLKSIRNVLAQPFEKYWPLIDVADQELITNKLNEYLPATKRKKIKITWKERKSLTKEEVKNRKLALATEVIQPSNDILKSVIFGINAVTRSMEKSNPTCVLLSSTVDPQILTNHICTLASLKKIPLLILNNLEDILMSTVGFKATTIAFKCDDGEDYFKDLCDNILNISRKFPITDRHRNNIEKSPVLSKEEECNSHLNQNEINIAKAIHLTRLSNKSRAFIPPKSQVNEIVDCKDFGDFISINNNESVKTVSDPNPSIMEVDDILDCYIDTKPTIRGDCGKQQINSKSKCNGEKYIPLKVKRIQGNPNKTKKRKRLDKKKKS